MTDRRSPVLKVGLLILVAALLSGGSWLLGAHVARGGKNDSVATAPKASLLTAVVTDEPIVTSINGRASIGFDQLTSVEGPASGGSITAVPVARGDMIAEGDVVAEVDGRPIVALVGAVPMYRPLVMGETGSDVEAFENALTRLAIDPGPVDGVFDERTAVGTQAFFQRLGYQPKPPTMEQRAAYAAAVEGVTQARLKVLTDRHQLDLDLEGPDPAERARLQAAIDEADRATAKARRDLEALGPLIDAEERSAQLALDAAQRAVTTATAGADRDQATDTVTSARTELEQIRLQRPNRIADAVAAVAASETAANVSRSDLSEALTSRGRELLRRTLEVAEESLRSAEQRVADQASIVGAGVQTFEIAFFPTLPRRVESVSAKEGEPASGPIMTVAGDVAVGRWFVDLDDRERLAVNGAVNLSDSATGTRVDGTIARVATTPGDPAGSAGDASNSDTSTVAPPAESAGSANDGRYLVTITLEPPDGVDLDSLVGRDVLVDAPVAQSGPGLAVPTSAIASAADGEVVVLRQTSEFESAPVRSRWVHAEAAWYR